jgi:hypothetical protein
MSLMLLGGPIPPTCSDAVVPVAPSAPILTTPVGIKGIRVEEDGHKLVFLTFPFENIKVDGAYPDNQKTFVARTMSWFSPATGVESGQFIDAKLAIRQNAPNPFNPTTKIAFNVPNGAGHVTLTVYNVGGQVVRRLVDGPMDPGPHTVVWDGRSDDNASLASGIYFARLSSAGESLVRKMTLLK